MHENIHMERLNSQMNCLGGVDSQSMHLREEMARVELGIQGQNQALEIEDRKRIFKQAIILFLIHSMVFGFLLLTLRYAKS